MTNLSRRTRDAVPRPVRVASCESLEQLQPAQPRVLLGRARDQFPVGWVSRQDPVRQRVEGDTNRCCPFSVDEKEVRVVPRPPLEFSEGLRGSGRKLEVLDHPFASGTLAMTQEDLDQRVVDDRFAYGRVHEVRE